MHRPRRDPQSIRELFDLRPDLAQFGRKGRDAVRLFVPNVRDIADRRRAIGEACDRGEGHHRVADVVHVDVDPPEGARL